MKRKESETIQVQHETQGANKKPRVVWSVEMHQQVGGRCYLAAACLCCCCCCFECVRVEMRGAGRMRMEGQAGQAPPAAAAAAAAAC